MEIKINKAKQEDLEEIYNIELQSFSTPYPYMLLRSLMILFGELFIVARDEENIAGYAIGAIRHRYMGHVISIAVKPEYRNRGIGKSLLRTLETYFRSMNALYSYLEVDTSNSIALNLYRKASYLVMGTHKDYYGKGKHAFVMIKNLHHNLDLE
ncbi:ribosomal-protein-alanine N-acetyltransferase RimI [Sulfolobales archaeon HS-7]|nr:ribosomal-protein-alanine N-acetyltransferase RimI [Sulfolobales archaeon HS-7]